MLPVAGPRNAAVGTVVSLAEEVEDMVVTKARQGCEPSILTLVAAKRAPSGGCAVFMLAAEDNRERKWVTGKGLGDFGASPILLQVKMVQPAMW